MVIGDILFVASVFLLFVIFAFGVASLQLGCYACYRRRALATSSRRGRWRRGGGGGTGWHPDLAGLRPGGAPRSLPAATVYRAAAPGPKEECAVCLAELEDGEQARFLPCCGHEFHAECVDVWLASRSTCPPLCGIDVARRAAAPGAGACVGSSSGPAS